MIRDITLGQYYNADSVIHRLDPRIKIIASLLYIVELFVVDSFIGFFYATAALGLVIALSKVPLSFIFRGMKALLIILIFTFVINLFMIDGTIIFKLWIFTISKEGLYAALFMTFRLVLLITGTSLLTLTTKPISLTDGLERLLYPLSKLKVPTHEIAMMMTIALRFIPTLLEETDKIIKAQQARGADFESGNLINRAKNLIPIIVPLFVSAFRIAHDLAMAMEARCYKGGEGRTRLHPMKYGKRDLVAYVLVFAFLASIILLRIFI
ncbi:MAG: energy-coupling factor transporter transmembrane protein EcfT [Clostridia bacterium]|nr:energy-coupling factor transporter transmembrane protein EcfT [Clostridia bacterium]